MASTRTRVASVLTAAGVAVATPSVAFAAPQAPAAPKAPAAVKAPAAHKPNWKILWEPPSDDDTRAAARYWKRIGIKGHKQKKGNWCGPAAATTALTAWTGVKVRGGTQAYLAKKFKTDKVGFTWPTTMAREMTRFINKETKRKGQKYWAHKKVKNFNLYEGVRGSYYYGTGPIILVVSAKKSWYPKAGKAVAHYVVVYGFDDSSYQESQYLIWDPAHGKRTLKPSKWQSIAFLGKGGARLVVSGKNFPL